MHVLPKYGPVRFDFTSHRRARRPNPSPLSTGLGRPGPPWKLLMMEPLTFINRPGPAQPPTPHCYWLDPSLLLARPLTSIDQSRPSLASLDQKVPLMALLSNTKTRSTMHHYCHGPSCASMQRSIASPTSVATRVLASRSECIVRLTSDREIPRLRSGLP